MDEHVQSLEREYCPPIDPALFHAVCADFEGSEDAASQVRALLDPLKAAALEEQGTDFDPSGSSGFGDAAAVRSSPSKGGSDGIADEWRSQTTAETEYTNLSNDVSTLSLEATSGTGSEDSSEGTCFRESEHLDTRSKELILAETFPQLRLELVTYTLRKCGNNLSRATDELLNRVYFEHGESNLEEDGKVAKGIDAFGEEYHVPQRGKKGKGKKKQKASFVDVSSLPTSDSEYAAPAPTNRWKDANREVEFIASRTNISSATVSSLFHRNGASTPTTIMALINKDLASHKNEDQTDTETLQLAIELTEEFPALDLRDAISLIRLTAPSTANAHQLAKALLASPSSTTTTGRARGGIEVIPRYAPINLSSPNTLETNADTKLPTLPPSATAQTSASLSAARSTAFTQASAAYRKGRSTPLMKAAAGYYAQVGRDYNANLKAMTETDADALVTSQSTSTYLDLHGVSVQSATRIAKERTKIWWDGLGEARIPGGGRAGVGEGYSIITGLGRHSEGGRGKIGPAVVRSLLKEGWKVEIGTGELVVTGLARRR